MFTHSSTPPATTAKRLHLYNIMAWQTGARQAIQSSNDIEIMENLTLVTMETANSFHDVMKMKYGVFLATVKHIRMTQLMENPEWREAYIKWQAKEAYKNGTIEKQTQPDLEGLMSLQSSL